MKKIRNAERLAVLIVAIPLSNMKIGPTQYTEEETLRIQEVRNQIESLQSEENLRYENLIHFLKRGMKEVDEDYLWDYIFNGFNPSEED